MVYINEAHALDSAMPLGGRGGAPLVEEPRTYEERQTVAQTCAGALDMAPIRMLVDGIDNRVGTAYAAWPDRLYLVGLDGKLAYAGKQGPFGFSPNELEDAIRVQLELEPRKRTKPERSPR